MYDLIVLVIIIFNRSLIPINFRSKPMKPFPRQPKSPKWSPGLKLQKKHCKKMTMNIEIVVVSVSLSIFYIFQVTTLFPFLVMLFTFSPLFRLGSEIFSCGEIPSRSICISPLQYLAGRTNPSIFRRCKKRLFVTETSSIWCPKEGLELSGLDICALPYFLLKSPPHVFQTPAAEKVKSSQVLLEKISGLKYPANARHQWASSDDKLL